MIVIDQWAKRFKDVLETNKVSVYLLRKHIDDVNLAISKIIPGITKRVVPDEIPRLFWS